jgi:hypothetical protein
MITIRHLQRQSRQTAIGLMTLALGACTAAPSDSPSVSATAVMTAAQPTISVAPSLAQSSIPTTHDSFVVVETPHKVESGTFAAIRLLDGRVMVTRDLGQLFEPSSQTFVPTHPKLDGTSSGSTSLLPDGRVLVVGTADDAGSEIFDPSTNAFELGPAMVDRAHQQSVFLVDGRVLAFGGLGSSSEPLATAEIYDPATNSFVATGSMHSGRENATVTRLPDGRVLVAGGDVGDQYSLGPLASAEIYDPASGTYTSTDSMNTPRTWACGALLDDGRVLVVGGVSVNNESTGTAEIYDPSSGHWVSAGEIPPFSQGVSVTLNDGRVLVVGSGPTGFLFNPATDTWSPTSANPIPVEGGNAVLLDDGSVLLISGTYNEIYYP